MKSPPGSWLTHIAPAVAFLLATTSGCGGGGGGGGGEGSANNPAPQSVQRYAVGGTVFGLASGTTVSLQNNGADSVNVAANSSFTFPSRLATGSAYSVAVSAQPAGQTCVVNGGAGTMASADIAISVSCRANVSLGGTVLGLRAGNSVTLRNNGGDRISLNGNSAFTFPSQVSYLSTYLVTVEVQPQGQTCAVNNGGGVANANVGNITVQCASFEILWNFGVTDNDGQYPDGAIIRGTDGNFYGTTANGGEHQYGVMYRMTPAGDLSILWNFGASSDGAATDGAGPLSSVIQASDGNFYGTTAGGGEHGAGTIFRITPAGVHSVLHSFGSVANDGLNPRARLLQASDGNFYGTTFAGGSADWGTIFKISAAGQYSVVWHFSSTDIRDGKEAWAALIEGSDGNFYGTTSGGGVAHWGTVYRMTPDGQVTVLWSFVPSSVAYSGYGLAPVTALVEGRDGNFYGTTYTGDSNVFQTRANGSTGTFYQFGLPTAHAGHDGEGPETELIIGNDGNFYGTTHSGGLNYAGTIFKLTPQGDETIVWHFGRDAEGQVPSSLIQASDGTFYGTTRSGGAAGFGTFFKLVL